jgi:dolichyl-phosphate beta-glucosyltransferase
MNTNRPELSIIIPAYNEEKRLPATLDRILEYCRERPDRSYELIVVDDGSTDRTIQVVEAAGAPIRLVHRAHEGKGAAVQAGVLASQGEWLLFTDSDMSTPIETLDRFWSRRDTADIVIGSRALHGSVIRKAQSRGKSWLGRFGNIMIRWLAVPGIHDTQCGFKLFHNRCRFIFGRQRIRGWGFDIELLFLAKKYGFRIEEIPVEWTNDTASKVRSTDYFRTFLELLTIRLNDFRGFYR